MIFCFLLSRIISVDLVLKKYLKKHKKTKGHPDFVCRNSWDTRPINETEEWL